MSILQTKEVKLILETLEYVTIPVSFLSYFQLEGSQRVIQGNAYQLTDWIAFKQLAITIDKDLLAPEFTDKITHRLHETSVFERLLAKRDVAQIEVILQSGECIHFYAPFKKEQKKNENTLQRAALLNNGNLLLTIGFSAKKFEEQKELALIHPYVFS